MSATEIESLELRIITPLRTVFSGSVNKLTVTGAAGVFEVLPGHESLLTPLGVGLFAFVVAGETEERLCAIHGGFLEITKGGREAVLLADQAEFGEEVDLERARAARQRAEERLSRLTDRAEDAFDRDRARFALLRAITRIQVAEKKAFPSSS